MVALLAPIHALWRENSFDLLKDRKEVEAEKNFPDSIDVIPEWEDFSIIQIQYLSDHEMLPLDLRR
jgi:hypothetical protein